jgi:hypothetical protein
MSVYFTEYKIFPITPTQGAMFMELDKETRELVFAVIRCYEDSMAAETLRNNWEDTLPMGKISDEDFFYLFAKK